MKLLRYLSIFLSFLFLNAQGMEQRAIPHLLPAEMTNAVLASFFNKELSSQKILDRIDDALAFLKTNKFYWNQREILIKVLRENLIDYSKKSPLEYLDLALEEAVKTDRLEPIHWLIESGAMLCREPDHQSCHILINAIKKGDKKQITVILKTLSKMISFNKNIDRKFYFEYGARNRPYPKAQPVGGQKGYITLGGLMESGILENVLKSSDKNLIKYILHGAYNYKLPELVREIIFPSIPTNAVLIAILKSPAMIQKYLLKQAKKVGFLAEMLNYSINYRLELGNTPMRNNMLQYAILNLAYEPGILDTIENLLEFGKRVGIDQISEPFVINGQTYNLKEYIAKEIDLNKELLKGALSEEKTEEVVNDLRIYESIKKLLALYS